MSKIEISEVSSRRERNAFIKFPWRIYVNDPAWVPPLIIERKAFLDRKRHPFYKHGDAALFLARKNSEIVGRIMASDDPNYNSLHQSNVGCFGLFECVNNRDVAAALFERAESWLRERRRTEIMGPIDYSTNYVCGLLIDGFQFPPTILTAHNPPYYRDLIESCGFTKAKDWYAWWFADPAKAVAQLRRLAARFNTHCPASVRSANLGNLRDESRRLRQIYNQAWEKNWGFVPFTEAEIEFMTSELKPLLVPEFAWIAEIANEPVGFTLCLPDINVVLCGLNGRLTRFGLPIGLIKLLLYKRRIQKGRLIALGVVEKYRRAGIAEMLVLRVMEETMVKRGITGELSMTLEDNFMINRFLEAIGAHRYKTYRIFTRTLTE
ncbi:MAG TPA: GNAT family N-acetyltransferase [Candidatus Dormibacteraeota bacterium]|nr:GNAT family N-acetyltransferase [Candidatus Dormibacteraeota bacterium]